jgi:hypothetical protein
MIFWYNFFPEFYRIVPVQTMDDGTEKDKEMPEVATNKLYQNIINALVQHVYIMVRLQFCTGTIL